MPTEYFVWSGDNMVYEYVVTPSITGTVYVYGINLITSRNNAGVEKYYLYNAHGDVVQLVSSSGTVTKTYNYNAFGVEYNPDANDTNDFRYCGQYFDTESGTYYLRARYYDPANGRFTQQDGWEYLVYSDTLSLNLYTYCKCNPIMYTDPTGHFPWVLVFIIVVVAISFSSCKSETYTGDLNDGENKNINPGAHKTPDEALNAAFDTAQEYANSRRFEHGIFVYKKGDYYYNSTPYNSHQLHGLPEEVAEEKILVDEKVVKDPEKNINTDAEILAFIHTHPHHNETIIFDEGEIAEMNDYDYYVVDPGGCTYKANSESEVDKIAQYPVRKGSCYRDENY